jgi:hypothetical protein
MRRLVTFLFVLVVAQTLTLGQQIHPLVAEVGYADLILTNGKIVPNTPGHICGTDS